MSIHLERALIDLSAPDALSVLRKRLREKGMAFFRLADPEAPRILVRLAMAFGPLHRHDHADADGVTILAPARSGIPSARGPGFSHNALAPHTDCSSVADAPELLFFMCLDRSRLGGESVLVDMREVFHTLQRRDPDALSALLRRDQVIFGTGRFTHRGSVFEQDSDGRIRVRFRLDDAGFFSGSVVRPVSALLDAIEAHEIRLRLGPGEGYVVNNTWWLHGRSGFAGDRKMLRVLAHIDPSVPENALITKGFVRKQAMCASEIWRGGGYAQLQSVGG